MPLLIVLFTIERHKDVDVTASDVGLDPGDPSRSGRISDD